MLNKRTQILFEEKTWEKLFRLALSQNTSVGNLVRNAVEEKYIKDDKLTDRVKAIESTLRNRLKFKGKIDYKELINYGRKY